MAVQEIPRSDENISDRVNMDKLTRRQRSANMRQIRCSDTKPEMIVRRFIHGLGFRYRLHVGSLPGRPDIVLPRHMKIIDVRGCFWHLHARCVDGRIPRSKTAYWAPKLQANVQRDQQNTKELRRLGYQVLALWECQILSGAFKQRLLRFLTGPD